MSGMVVAPGRRRRRMSLPRSLASGLTWLGVALLVIFILLAVIGPMATGDPTTRTGLPLEPPSAAHLFGTDHLGRDLLARTASGARLSLVVAVSSVALGLLVAVPAGMLAGFAGGRWGDEIIMRVLDALQALPFFVFALFILGLLGTGTSQLGPLTLGPATKVVLLLAVSFLPYFARVARATTLVEVQEEYVDSLRVVGVPRWRIIFTELLPNILPPVLVQGFLWVGVAIFAESALSYLGMGIQPPSASLGTILGDATSSLLVGAWWYSIIPGLVILIATLGVNLAGDAVADSMGRRN